MLFDDFVFPGNYELHREAYEIQQNTHYIFENELVTKRRAKRNFRKSILEAWDNRCAYCGAPGDTLDHVRPRSRGGETKRSNLICCCAAHNSNKSSQDWVEWYRAQPFWTAEREGSIWIWLHQDFNSKDWAQIAS
jgi:hypothetical protein